MPNLRRRFLIAALSLTALGLVRHAVADDGYRLWLRYDPIVDDTRREAVAAAVPVLVLTTPSGTESPTIEATRRELQEGFSGLVGRVPEVRVRVGAGVDEALGDEGYRLTSRGVADGGGIEIRGNGDVAVLYGAFALLRRAQTGEDLARLQVVDTPRVGRRLLNHWDNLNRFVERGYAGFSIWEWFNLPDFRNPRYRDYARACASIGLNGAVLTNVNADALVLTPYYLERVAALAEEFRPYGVRVYLTARFSAPKEIGGLDTADPLDPRVIAWWDEKVAEIYRWVPDFGGFVVKANSEGQPGPQDFGRNHADGANLFARALAPHGGIVMWRAFVYQPENEMDRVRQASFEFMPLDGAFLPNVSVQIKNGPLDFMPREPFHPLFGSLQHTSMTLELQITQEYLGHSTHLAFLAPMWKEVFEADTFARGPGSTVGKAIDGTLRGHPLTVVAGVSNIGTDRNWTGHPLAQANWYAFGRLAWDHTLEAETIAEEWSRMTFGSEPATVAALTDILVRSREIVVNYSNPYGLHHIQARGHHFGPGPWVTGGRPDWTAPYYHQASEFGIGANRGPEGSNALADYAPELAALWGDLERCPENLLLWFHHLPWDYVTKSGRTLWDAIALRYQQGVDEMRRLAADWAALEPAIDPEIFANVSARMGRQVNDAIHWRDACLLYFQQFSKRPLPEGVEPPAHSLEHYMSINLRYVPGHPGDY
ncbi:alpha-glucuronidase family glycosyl hydrolase [Opitutales bacterium ASA1]|uniref:alpha-glucuronidase family glycosyl hydrolase n=1 Tax=Congregicoccus parvus TaxID=3081749 RepID=UPI002B2DA060|nr:alpha-glucuronidase family glycosyl hydrolase [Opitutales bacterium ASA1]